MNPIILFTCTTMRYLEIRGKFLTISILRLILIIKSQYKKQWADVTFLMKIEPSSSISLLYLILTVLCSSSKPTKIFATPQRCHYLALKIKPISKKPSLKRIHWDFLFKRSLKRKSNQVTKRKKTLKLDVHARKQTV